jgi:hypothetical protein
MAGIAGHKGDSEMERDLDERVISRVRYRAGNRQWRCEQSLPAKEREDLLHRLIRNIGVCEVRSGDRFSGFIIYRVDYFSMQSNRQYLREKYFSAYCWLDGICERRLNGKSGAVIGLAYSLVALGYFLICFSILQGPSVPPGQPICDGCTDWIFGYIFLGFFIFFPVTVPDFITLTLLSFVSHADILGYVALALLPVYGTVIGGVIGYYFKRDGVKQ